MATRRSGRGRTGPHAARRGARRALATEATHESWRRRLEQRLRMKLGTPVALTVTDNTYTMISFARRGAGYGVRLHHMFLEASEDVLVGLAAYIRGDDRRASSVLDRFIHENRRHIRQLTPRQRQRRLPLASKGRWHDLQRILDDVRDEFFRTTARGVAIAWAPAPSVRLPRRSIKLGSYSADTQIVRIHPALDQRAVPEYFVRWIVFHELLHHIFRAELKARTGRVHTHEFCRLERNFPDYRNALAWERRNLDLLLWWMPAPRLDVELPARFG